MCSWRKNRGSMATNNGEDLIEALIKEILLRLSTKSLLRFKCVCKNWYTLIKKILASSMNTWIFARTSPTTLDLRLWCTPWFPSHHFIFRLWYKFFYTWNKSPKFRRYVKYLRFYQWLVFIGKRIQWWCLVCIVDPCY